MAYIHSLQGLGLDLGELITKGGPAIQAAAKVVEDPALPEVTCNVLRLNKIAEGKDTGGPCARVRYSAAQKRKGIGLHAAVMPLRVTVWARANPTLAVVAGAGVVGGFVALGYYLGTKERRR